MSQGFLPSRLQAAFRKFYGRDNDLVCNTTFLWSKCCLMCFIPIVKPFLIHWSWLRLEPFTWTVSRAHGGWPVDRGCLLLLGTWSHLWYVQRTVFALFSDLYFLQVLWDWLLFVIYVIYNELSFHVLNSYLSLKKTNIKWIKN
jgi:hypothetical protein